MDKDRTLQKEFYKTSHRLRILQGQSLFSLECFGDDLAKREGYKGLKGMDALFYYLVQKHHWLPSQVRALNVEDLELLFSEEREGWILPKDARDLSDP